MYKRQLVILLSRSNTGVPSEFTPVPEKSPIEYKDQADLICSFVAAKTGEAHITDAAIIIEVNLTGKASEAENGNWKTPFTDIPEWAAK